MIILITLIIIFTSGNLTTIGRSQGYQFSQLSPYYQESLFGVKFDYNSWSSPADSLRFLSNLISKENITDQVDPDTNSDNLMALIGHDSSDIQSAFLAVESIKRTETTPSFGSIEWQTSLPFVKYVLEFALPSGENVILSQDLLGIALKLEGQNFNSDNYQVGYANIPFDFLDFLVSSLSSGSQIPLYSNTTPMTIEIQEKPAGISVTTTYTNISFLFQVDDLDYEQLTSFKLSDQFLLMKFDSFCITVSLLKYSKPTNSGVETHVAIRVGNIINLIINEKFPTTDTWSNSSEVNINTKYRDLVEINETFSWYKNNDILKRMTVFNQSSFSLLLSQNLGILNGASPNNNFQIGVAGQIVPKENLTQQDILVQENVTVSREDDLIYINQLKGHNYVLNEDPTTRKLSVAPLNYNLISLNQHPSLSNNMLFLRETDLVSDFVAESVKHFIDNDSVVALSTDQLLKAANLYLTSAIFIQDFEIVEWKGHPSTIKIQHTAIRETNYVQVNLSNITNFPFLVNILPMVILAGISVKKGRAQRKKRN